MKDILKFAGTTLLMLVTLTLVGMIFIQSFMGDFDWLNALLTIVYSLAVLAAAVYDGTQRGAKDCKFSALMDRQIKEHGYTVSVAEQCRMYGRYKGFAAGAIAASPAIALSVATLFFAGDVPVWLTFATRVTLGAFLSVFQYVESWTPWIYLPLALLYPLFVGAGYLMGPKVWERQVKMMEKAKKEKRRSVKRRKKAKKKM